MYQVYHEFVSRKGQALGCNMTLKSCLQNDTDLDKEVHFLVTTFIGHS